MATLLDIRTRIKADLDLEDETYITDADINRWINEGIKKAEAEIHTLYEDYFLSYTSVSITTASNLVDYPSDIYGNKIRKIIFNDNDQNAHEVRRVSNLVRASERDIFFDSSSNATLEWSPVNTSSNGRKIRLFPDTSRAGSLIIWYIRNAKQLSADTDVCDIDEFERYVIQSAKTQSYLKDGDPRASSSKAIEDQLKVDMITTLSNMVPDNNNELPMDTSFYDDSVGGDY